MFLHVVCYGFIISLPLRFHLSCLFIRDNELSFSDNKPQVNNLQHLSWDCNCLAITSRSLFLFKKSRIFFALAALIFTSASIVTIFSGKITIFLRSLSCFWIRYFLQIKIVFGNKFLVTTQEERKKNRLKWWFNWWKKWWLMRRVWASQWLLYLNIRIASLFGRYFW